MQTVQPAFNPGFYQYKFNSTVAGDPEEIYANNKKYGIDKPGNKYPFPKLLFYNKFMCFSIGLYGNNDLFQHRVAFVKTIKLGKTNFPAFAPY